MITQPTYQVPWTKLADAQGRLDSMGLGEPRCSRPILFLCGLKFTHTYYLTAHEQLDARATWWGAGHLVDDGLNEACRRGLKTLIKIARSRSMRSGFPKDILERCNADWLFLELAFVSLEEALPPAVWSWLRVGDQQVNWVRLCFGMGVLSHWDATKYGLKVMKGPFGFTNSASKDVTTEVRQLLDTFQWNPQWVQPEL